MVIPGVPYYVNINDANLLTVIINESIKSISAQETKVNGLQLVSKLKYILVIKSHFKINST